MRELWHFTAEWCTFCKQMKPLIEEYLVANPTVEYIKIDIDEDKDAADQNKVEAVPTFVFFNKGNMVNRIDGAFDVEKIDEIFAGQRA
jgi:thioredoxin-like negative regulator of GroEL